MLRKIIILIVFVQGYSFNQLKGQDLQEQYQTSWINRLEFEGIAVQENGYHIWGCTPIIGPEGKTHLFVARYPESAKHYPGWHTDCEIAHYVSDSPEGPFTFCDVALAGTKKDTWDKLAPHNPTIHKIEGIYYLFYIANDGLENFPGNQKIGLAKSESLYGPWKRVGKDGNILSSPKNTQYWNYEAFNGVNNPAFLKHPSGGYFLYFKSEDRKMGLAIAEHVEGPYVQLPFPITNNNNKEVEDGYAFIMDDKICLLTTDNSGIIEKGGGLLWQSKDGINFSDPIPGYHVMQKYFHEGLPECSFNTKGEKENKFERPQVLVINGEPSYLYVASGTNVLGIDSLGDVSVSYVFKIRSDLN